MEKGKEVTLDSNSASAPEAAAAPVKNTWRRTVIKLAIAAVVVGAVLYVVLGGDPDEGQCNLFRGRWVPNLSGPIYNNMTCRFIDDTDNCLMNGRPDTRYLYWKWKPYYCDLPTFDPAEFMNAMRDKYWALVGDSILRNQMQSLICLLSEVEEPIEVYHDEKYKSRTVYFPNHNLTIATVWAPFLVKSNISETGTGREKYTIQLYLDLLESDWATDYHKYDYVVIAGGQWFLKTTVMWEDGKIIGCHNCGEEKVKEIGVYEPYRKALRHVLKFITSSSHKPLVIFRTWNPDHFEYGEWYNGGVCNRTEPYREGQFNGDPSDQTMQQIEIEEYRKAKTVASKRGIDLELLDTFHLSLLRPDGHPGPYRYFHPFDKDKSAKVQNDCLHWCLPGPVDTWNELVMKILSDAGALNSSTSYQKVTEGVEFASSM